MLQEVTVNKKTYFAAKLLPTVGVILATVRVGGKVSIFSEIFFSVENRKKYFFSAEKTEKPKKSLKPKKPKIFRGNPK